MPEGLLCKGSRLMRAGKCNEIMLFKLKQAGVYPLPKVHCRRRLPTAAFKLRQAEVDP
jgi:hypothetical protein